MADIVSLDPQEKGQTNAALRQVAMQSPISRIALVGNFPPRRCGISTFTVDTRDALIAAQPDLIVDVYAMDDAQGAVQLADDVCYIRQSETADYAAAADRINQSQADIAWIQHEFGIFGGQDGGFILALIGKIKIPIIVTLHTILEKPSPNQRRILDALIQRSDLLIVMAEKGKEILVRCYGVSDSKIKTIAHGIPDRPYVLPDLAKQDFGIANRAVILTFGLLSPEKGIGDMIEAMPQILRACPNALYLVLGATHPHVIAQSGNRLREGLLARVVELGIADHVRFIDEYVELDLLTRYLQAADVYVTPYHNPDQITSGTLSYAVGLGKPVVSTGYVHANELLGNGTGILVPFQAPEALAKAVTALLTNDGLRDQLARRAYRVGRTMTWARYAETALASFQKLGRAKAYSPSMRKLERLPIIGNSALERLTDDTGIFQHSRFGVADRHHGYCIDDNARALALVSVADDLPRETRSRLGSIYSAFVQHAWNPDVNAFRNFMHFDRHWLEDQGSSDSNGRTLWALALAATRHCDPLICEWANELYRETWRRLDIAHSPRATAFSLLAAVEMQTSGLGPTGTMSAIRSYSEDLLAKLRLNRRQDWNWFESVLAYDNCRLPEALIRAGHLLDDDAMICEGKAALGWIMRLQIAEEGWFRPVGSTSFGKPYAKPQPFDQQPIEALAAIDACSAAIAQQPTHDWIDWGESAFAWFTGANDLGVSLADMQMGECCDGLTPEGANANRGAESVLAWQAAARQILRLRETMIEVETTPERARR